MTAALTIHQQMIMARRVTNLKPETISAYLGSLRGGSAWDKFPKAADHIDVIERDGEAELYRLGIPAELRAGARLETRCGGPKWHRADWVSYGVIAHWKRTDTDWILVSAERRKLGGGRDKGWLTVTPEQNAFRFNHAAIEAYAIRARFSGDRDD